MSMDSMFNNMMRPVGAGMIRLGLNGQMAVKTNSGYKTYDVETGALTNVTQFCFDIGQEFYFVMPTTKAKKGDILLIDDKPKCVIENKDNKTIKVMDYESSAIIEIVPERHIFMGKTYFYRKIVSMFGSGSFLKGVKGPEKMMQFMMKMQMMKTMFNGGKASSDDNGMSNMMSMMMMSNMLGGKGGMFGDEDCDFSEMFDFAFEEDEDKAVEDKE